MIKDIRIGYSEDVHKFKKGNGFLLGTIKIESDLSIIAHSDGDLLLHAVAEAIFGALALGDLGTFFPDNDPKLQGLDSTIIVKKALELMRKLGYRISNLDTMIILQAPKLAPYKSLIQEALANLLDIEISKVSIKAGTNEGLDALGEGKAIKAVASILLIAD